MAQAEKTEEETKKKDIPPTPRTKRAERPSLRLKRAHRAYLHATGTKTSLKAFVRGLKSTTIGVTWFANKRAAS